MGGQKKCAAAGRTETETSVAEEQHLRHRQRVGMCDGEQRAPPRHGLEPAQRASRQPQLRRTTVAKHLDVLPEYAARVAGAQRFHRGFFRRETSGQARNRVALPRTIGNLDGGEHPVQEAIAVAIE